MESSNGKSSLAACRGATLIEVLVALTILSLGLTGLGAMQLKTLEHLRSVVYQSRAGLYAADMAERLHGYGTNELAIDGALARWRSEIRDSLPAGEAEVCIDSTPRDGKANAPACDGMGAIWAIKLWWDGNHDGSAERAHITVLRP